MIWVCRVVGLALLVLWFHVCGGGVDRYLVIMEWVVCRRAVGLDPFLTRMCQSEGVEENVSSVEIALRYFGFIGESPLCHRGGWEYILHGYGCLCHS